MEMNVCCIFDPLWLLVHLSANFILQIIVVKIRDISILLSRLLFHGDFAVTGSPGITGIVCTWYKANYTSTVTKFYLEQQLLVYFTLSHLTLFGNPVV